MPRLRALVLVAVLAVSTLGSLAPARATFSCTDDADTTSPIAANPAGITGRIGLPSSEPTHLVAFAHGYGHTSASWIEHIERTVGRPDVPAVAFATDYRGTYTDDAGNVRGWFVREGAQDTIDMTRALLALCPSIETVIIFGISMGANSSGLAIAAGATRADGSPLFDYWIAPEPAANVIETYLAAVMVESALPTAARARMDIEQQHGGTLWERPSSYLAGAIVTRGHEIAASGLKGAVVVHGFDDGLVPYDQGRELSTVLRANGVPTDFYNVVRRETNGTPTGSDNTTLTENVARPALAAAGQAYAEPLAGHGSESSQTHIVVRTAFDALYQIMAGSSMPANREYVADGEAGIIPLG